MGRLTARATSAARATAKFAAITEPFVESEIAFYIGPGQTWGKIVGGQLIRSFPGLRTRVDRITAAAWICEVVYRLTHEEQASADKFALLIEALEALEHATEFTALRLGFAVRFLRLVGLGLDHREPWMALQQRQPEMARALMEEPLASLRDTRWNEPDITALERLAGGLVMDHLSRPLHVNRFRQTMGLPI